MRVLFFGCPGFGHVVPQLPLARAIRERGDEVAFVAAASFGPLLEAEGIPLLAAGPEAPELVVELKRSTGVDILAAPPTAEVEAEIFAGARIDPRPAPNVAPHDPKPPDSFCLDTRCGTYHPVTSAAEQR